MRQNIVPVYVSVRYMFRSLYFDNQVRALTSFTGWFGLHMVVAHRQTKNVRSQVTEGRYLPKQSLFVKMDLFA